MKDEAQPSTKDSLRDAARDLIAARGYAAVSMREIAQVVGVRPAAIYNHFPSKQDILVDLMEVHMVDLLAALDAALDGVEGPQARYRAFCAFHVGYHIDFPKDVFLAYMELRSLEPENLSRVVALRNRYEAVLRGILTDLALEDPAVTGRMILALLTGVTNWYQPDGPLSRDEVVAIHVARACGAVGVATT